MMEIGIYAGIIFVALLIIGLIFTRLYRRATKEIGFVRTGFGGEKVVINGGALVLPVLHETMQVNLNTVRLAVERKNNDALITLDRLRIDVKAEFYVRVRPDRESMAIAAQTLGLRTMQPESLKELIEGKFVDALRSVAAGMTMSQLHEQRAEFVQKVQQVSAADLAMNGLELESVSLTGLDQTSIEHFNANNAFDAEGLTKLTEQIELRKKARNDIEQETRVQIETKNLDAEKRSLDLARETQFARLEQEREVEVRRAAQMAEVAQEQSIRQREAEGAKITAKQQVDSAQIEANRIVEQAQDRAGAGGRDRAAGAADRGPEQEPRGKPGEGRGRYGARRGGGRGGAGRHRARDRDRRARQEDRADRGGQGGRAAGDRGQGPGRRRKAGGGRPGRGGARSGQGRGRGGEAPRRGGTGPLRGRGGRPARDQRGGEPALVRADLAADQAGLAEGDAGAGPRGGEADGGDRFDQDRPGRRPDRRRRQWRGGGNGRRQPRLDAVAAALRYRAQAPIVDGLMKELGFDGATLDNLVAGATAGTHAAPAPPAPAAPKEVPLVAAEPAEKKVKKD